MGRHRLGLSLASRAIGTVMIPKNRQELEARVIRAAETALSRKQFVSAIDVFCGMDRLSAKQVDDWRKGRIDFLERVIQGNMRKISLSMAIFRRWARDKKLQPRETGYVRRTRSGRIPLQFSKSGDPQIEKSYRTHYKYPGALKIKPAETSKEALPDAVFLPASDCS